MFALGRMHCFCLVMRFDPDHNCPLCPRLVAFREEWRAREPDWHIGPVDTWSAQKKIDIQIADYRNHAESAVHSFTDNPYMLSPHPLG